MLPERGCSCRGDFQQAAYCAYGTVRASMSFCCHDSKTTTCQGESPLRPHEICRHILQKEEVRDYRNTKKAVDCPLYGRRICSLKRKVRNCGHENGAVCSCAGGGVQNQTRTTQQLQQAAPAVGGHRQQFESVDPHCKCDRPSKCFTVGQSAKPTGRYVALCEG